MSPSTDDIKVYDSSGREFFISREKFRKQILPKQFHDVHNDPDQLYNVIVISLQDGFFKECVAPAQRLLQIDSDRERATVVLAIAQMKSGNLDAAYDLLTAYLRDIGPSGIVLTNLAKVYAERGDESQAQQALWLAITTDPNQENALEWWMALQNERGGMQARSVALQRVAEIPGSWRAQLWLARASLENGKRDDALNLYRSVIPHCSKYGDALMMISGDLGTNGLAGDALEIVAPVYDPAMHGPMTGLNLIQACIQVNDIPQGKKFLSELELLNRHDLKMHLADLRQRLR